MKVSLFIIAFFSLGFAIAITSQALGIAMPRPPAVKIVDAKVSHRCLELFESWLRTKPVGSVQGSVGAVYGPNRAAALGIRNTCQPSIDILSIETKGDSQSQETPIIMTINKRRFTFAKEGEACHATSTFSILNRFLYDDDPPSRCKSLTVDSGDIVHIAIPYGHEFTISGVTSDKTPFAVKGKLINPGDPEQSIKYFLQEAETQDPEAILKLYSLYRQKQNYSEALKWLRKAAEMNNLNAQFLLGSAYADGKIIERNCEEALKWLSIAAEKGEVTTIRERELSQSRTEMMTEFYGEAAQKELGKVRALVCGHDYLAAVKLWKDDEAYLSTIENAKIGYAAAQENLVYRYRDRAANLRNEANFWLNLATKNNPKYQWVSANQLTQGEIIDVKKDLGAPNKAELTLHVKEENLKNLSLLPASAIETMAPAFQGDTTAQYHLSRALFEEAIKSYEEGYFWGLLTFQRMEDWQKEIYKKDHIEKPMQFLTGEQVQAIEIRVKEWSAPLKK